MATEKMEFQTEVRDMLNLMINSLYSNKEIFLRELVSNAADALDKRRFLSLSNADLLPQGTQLRIDISVNKEGKRIVVEDNGIGMNKEDLINCLGTIARSGTKNFIKNLKEGDKGSVDLIGQFGVGFYSVFMVAKKVEVLTLKAGETQGYMWSSEGTGEFEISEAPRDKVGTKITLYLKDDEDAVDFAYRLNARGTANVAAACNRRGVRLIAISTDYVFAGDSDRPYCEFDAANGGNTVYGKSKFAGEELVRQLCPDHCICRISWLYGFGGPSFVHAMMNLADGSRPVLKVVADQHGNPTSALAVARQLGHLLERPKLRGTFHMTCEGEATWAEFAEEIFRIAGRRQAIQPCTTEEFPRPAPRPKNSRLDKMMFRISGLPPMPDWREALAEFMKLEFSAQ